jgi:hypothetical protein
VVIGDKITGVILFGKLQSRFYGPKVITDMEDTRGFDPGKGNFLHADNLPEKARFVKAV